jgi:hypothetical protein
MLADVFDIGEKLLAKRWYKQNKRGKGGHSGSTSLANAHECEELQRGVKRLPAGSRQQQHAQHGVTLRVACARGEGGNSNRRARVNKYLHLIESVRV